MSTLKAKIAAVATFAVATSTAILVSAGSAAAAVNPVDPSIVNDPNASNGTIAFYDSTGTRVTSGTNLGHLFDYALASSPAGRAGSTKATLFLAFPDHTQSDSQNWVEQQQSSSTNYPNANAPAALKSSPNPLVTLTAANANLNSAKNGVALDTTSGFAGIVQVRLYDSGAGVSKQAPFWATDISYDSSGWTQVAPTLPTTSLTVPSGSPASPAPSGTTSVALSSTLSASDGSHPAGSVELFDGTTDLGAATLNQATGAVSGTASVADSGSYNFTFVFTPSGNYAGSTSPALAYVVKGQSVATTTVLSGPSSAEAGSGVNVTAKVTHGSTALTPADGKVTFTVNGGTPGAPVALDSSGTASFTAQTAQGDTQVSIVANFVPTDATAYKASSDGPLTVPLTAPAYPTDPQTVTVTVPKGTLVISTPYTPANPFKLGTMTLNPAGTQYHAASPFGDAAAAAAPGGASASQDPTSNGVTITDTRANSQGWTASAQTSDFTNAGLATVIPGNNLSFLNVTPKYLTGNNLQTGDVHTNDITAFKTAKKSFASTTKGPGTVDITGVLDLTAPTSTLPGDYTATVTFTIA